MLHSRNPIGCGLHIAEVLADLPLEQICSCDDDRDSEHSWATLPNQSTTSASMTAPDSASLYPLSQSTLMATRTDPTGHCPDPSPVEYKLSKISSSQAEAAVSRKAQQAAALEQLKKIKEQKDRELKEANEKALERLLHGLSETKETAD
ncbi:hypothetical protein BGX27_008222 [Mortierella sp. AM989]|nr:hypothetical protein BGX27_008222 [Mortierella sp. AM989]